MPPAHAGMKPLPKKLVKSQRLWCPFLTCVASFFYAVQDESYRLAQISLSIQAEYPTEMGKSGQILSTLVNMFQSMQACCTIQLGNTNGTLLFYTCKSVSCSYVQQRHNSVLYTCWQAPRHSLPPAVDLHTASATKPFHRQCGLPSCQPAAGFLRLPLRCDRRPRLLACVAGCLLAVCDEGWWAEPLWWGSPASPRARDAPSPPPLATTGGGRGSCP